MAWVGWGVLLAQRLGTHVESSLLWEEGVLPFPSRGQSPPPPLPGGLPACGVGVGEPHAWPSVSPSPEAPGAFAAF